MSPDHRRGAEWYTRGLRNCVVPRSSVTLTTRHPSSIELISRPSPHPPLLKPLSQKGAAAWEDRETDYVNCDCHPQEEGRE